MAALDLLLLSNSRTAGGSYLGHALEAIGAAIGSRRRALFLPFAGVTVGWDEFSAAVADALAPLGIDVAGAHRCEDPAVALAATEIVLVGGGNTFRLLAEARRRGWLAPLRRAVAAGVPYVGWSAGANLATPTIRTTNDMPIVDPGGLDALGLVDFQLNCHFTDQLPPGHQGESRTQRIAEFHALNPTVPVIGLPEGDWLTVRGTRVRLHGPHPALLFRAGAPAAQIGAGGFTPG
jgi:dipeptidase E